MKRKKNKIVYVLHLNNKTTGQHLKDLTYKNQEQALKDKDFYNSTLNLSATLDTVIER